jgi:hypothetical protein
VWPNMKRGKTSVPESRTAEIVFELTSDTPSATDLLSTFKLIDYAARSILTEESQTLLETLGLSDGFALGPLTRLSKFAKTRPVPLTVSRVERGSWHIVTQINAESIVLFVQQTMAPLFMSIWQDPNVRQKIAEFLVVRAFGELEHRIRRMLVRKQKMGNVAASSVSAETSTQNTSKIKVRLEVRETLEVEGDDMKQIREILREFRNPNNP